MEATLGPENFAKLMTYGSPIFAHVHNFDPTMFAAFLHFYFWDWGHKGSAHPINADKEIGFYLGRFFFQKAWPKSGYYMLPEVQLIYDSKVDEGGWSAMIRPEVGKTVFAGEMPISAYIKPGWGVSPDPGERSFSVEMGMRFIP